MSPAILSPISKATPCRISESSDAPIFVSLQVISRNLVIAPPIFAMIDTGSTYNVMSLDFFLAHVHHKNPFPATNPLAPRVVFHDGQTTIHIQGQIQIELRFHTLDDLNITFKVPFCVLDYPVSYGLVLGQKFLIENLRFDISH